MQSHLMRPCGCSVHAARGHATRPPARWHCSALALQRVSPKACRRGQVDADGGPRLRVFAQPDSVEAHGRADGLHVAAQDATLRGPAPPEHRHIAAPQTALSTLRAELARAPILPNVRPGLDRRGVVLHVLHGWGGGVEQFAHDLADGDNERWHLALFSRGEYSRRRCGEALELALLHDGQAWPLARFELAAAIVTCAVDSSEWRAVFEQVRRRFGIGSVIVSSACQPNSSATTTSRCGRCYMLTSARSITPPPH